MVNITELNDCIKDCYHARIPLLIVGGPGIAKTDLIEQFAQSIGVECHPFDAGALDPSSFGITIPRLDNSACDMIPTAQFVDQAPGSVQFIDELDKMDTLIQNTMLPFIQNNRLHGKKLSERWTVMAANHMHNGKGTYEISPILRNRVCRIEFAGPTLVEWTDHAVKCNISYKIIAFLEQRNYSHLLNAYDPKADASPTPRQWFKCSGIVDSKQRMTLMTGLIGAKAAAEFEVFDKLTSRLPSYPALVASNGNFKVPEDFVLQSILATMISANVDGAEAKIIKPVLDQLPMEFLALIFKRAMARKAKGIDAFVVQNNYIDMMTKILHS